MPLRHPLCSTARFGRYMHHDIRIRPRTTCDVISNPVDEMPSWVEQPTIAHRIVHLGSSFIFSSQQAAPFEQFRPLVLSHHVA
jgi:hypothetical protein